MEQTNYVQPIDLGALLIRLRIVFFRLWALVLALAALAGLFFYARAKQSYVPMYESKAIFTIEAGYYAEDIFQDGAYYDHYLAQRLAKLFPQLMTQEIMTDLVVQELDKGYINGFATATSVADSNMLILSVKSTDPYDAYDYLCALIDCFPQIASFSVDNPQIKIMTAPNLPTQPCTAPPGIKTFIKGAILGAAVGFVLLIICAMLSHTVQNPDELKRAINLPILIALPKVVQKKRRNGTTPLITAESNPGMAESLRGLRMKVKKLLADNNGKSVLITSTLAGEGKTTIAINLAQSLVQDGHKVILLDADLRNQSVARALGEKATGNNLMDLLKNRSQPVLNCVRTIPSGLSFISGRSIDLRHYALDATAIRQLLSALSEHYDYIVIDTPPSDIVSDSAALCRCADCVLYVVRQDHTQKGQIINAVTSLHQKDVRIAGCVFNGVPQHHRGYGYGSTYSYGYGSAYMKYGYSKSGKYSTYSSHSDISAN